MKFEVIPATEAVLLKTDTKSSFTHTKRISWTNKVQQYMSIKLYKTLFDQVVAHIYDNLRIQ